MRAILIAVLALTLLGASGAESHASCVSADLEAQVTAADIIVEGTVRRALDPGLYEVVIGRSLKGDLSGAIRARTAVLPGGVSSVDLELTPGAEYTLYLTRDTDGLATSACSGSHEGPATQAELGASGRAAGGASGRTAAATWLPGLLLAIGLGVTALSLASGTRRMRLGPS